MNEWDLYNAKVMGIEATETDAMRAGSYLEDGIARMYRAELGGDLRVRKPNGAQTRRHGTHPWMLASIDREAWVNGERVRLVEVKHPGSRYEFNPRTGERELVWGHSPDEIPAYIQCQVQWQMEITGATEVDVVALFAETRELAIYRQPRNHRMIDSLIAINGRFWHEHIVPQVPPEIDASVGSGAYLNSAFPRNKLGLEVAPTIVQEYARDYARARRDLKDAEARKLLAGNRLRQLIGWHEGFTGHWGKVTWKLDANGAPDHAAIAGELRTRVELLAVAAGKPELADDLDALFNKHRAAPARHLRVTYRGDLDDELERQGPELQLLQGGAA